jgi:hypothetical protein
MKLIQKARLIYPDQRTQLLGLFQVETAVFRWVVQDTDRRFDGVDYVDKPSAVVGLRVTVEGDPAFKGVDLTVLSVEPGPAERAARRIVDNYEPDSTAIDWVSGIIQEETAIDQLREAGETLEAYLITRGGQRDLALGGLMLNFLDALEKSGGVKYDAIRRALTEPPPQIIPARNMPGNKLVQ